MDEISFKIADTEIGLNHPTYFIADIAANHDGDINKAIDLIHLCAENGANAAKFQNFFADTIVSDFGFKALETESLSHQSAWRKEWGKSVYDVYKEASIPLDWTPRLKDACKQAKIDYFTAPYDISILDELDKYVVAWKVGSGDITWLEMISNLSSRNKPILIATGASEMSEVKAAIEVAQKVNKNIVLMQCNTNYTASEENIKYVNLNVLKNYAINFKDVVLGLSDHTPGHSTVLGAVALGARVIEKHFTNSNELIGPDHKFSMNPESWREMIKRTRELESSLGDGFKKVEDNENETVIIQRRAIRASKDLFEGELIKNECLIPLRPCPKNGLKPSKVDELIGRTLNKNIKKGNIVNFDDLR